MKTYLLLPVMAFAATLLAVAPAAQAQEPVSTGVIQGVAPKAGTITLRSDQTTRPITFYGMDKATIFTADGKATTIKDLQPGIKATVQYASRGKHWYVSKVILVDDRPPIVGAVINGDPALRTKAANDGDVTTQPGKKAAVDGDITTQPGEKAATDNDITTQPASRDTFGRVPVRRRGP